VKAGANAWRAHLVILNRDIVASRARCHLLLADVLPRCDRVGRDRKAMAKSDKNQIHLPDAKNARVASLPLFGLTLLASDYAAGSATTG
jgi:hypothetical protein